MILLAGKWFARAYWAWEVWWPFRVWLEPSPSVVVVVEAPGAVDLAALAALVVLVGQEVLARLEGLVGPAVGLVVLEVLGVGPVVLMMRAEAPVVLAVLGVGPVALTMRGVALEVLEVQAEGRVVLAVLGVGPVALTMLGVALEVLEA